MSEAREVDLEANVWLALMPAGSGDFGPYFVRRDQIAAMEPRLPGPHTRVTLCSGKELDVHAPVAELWAHFTKRGDVP